MPSRRRAQSRAETPDSDDARSDDTVLNTPPKARTGKKKRVTQFLVPLTNSESFTELQREQRRSSFRGPTESNVPDGLKTPRRRLSQINAVAMTPAIAVPKEVMDTNYEEWMKMATDNKINATNSWNVALIDYFADVSFLRNEMDNSINFQKASTTLDGCVKIWTSRVDSVGTETGKLLSNLANDGRDDEDDAEGNGDEEGGTQGENVRKRKGHRPESTLAKSAAQLRTKKFDLDFDVDPLFKKTQADFDEGGAQGLLMNHLGVDGNMRVVFDASDSTLARVDEEEEEAEDFVDLDFIRESFLPSLSALEDKAISHSLAQFSFGRDIASAFDATILNEAIHVDDPSIYQGDGDDTIMDTGLDSFADHPADFGAPQQDDGPVEDFFVGDQAVEDDYGPPLDDGAFEPADQSGEAVSAGTVPGPYQSFDPRRMPNERDFVMAMMDGEEGMMDYFDQGFLKNWAGPEHWKIRKVVRRVDPSEAAAAPKPRKEKKVFRIDMFDLPEISEKELFAPPKRGVSINLPAAIRQSKATKSKKKANAAKENKENRDSHTLPDDMHFSSRQLVTLFLKPKFSLKMRGQRVRVSGNDGEVDEQFWARAAADQAAGVHDQEEGDDTANGAMAFDTQFFHDDDGGTGFDDVFDGDGPTGDVGAAVDPEEADLLAATAGHTRRVRPETINYSKRAKRVDVRKLKENIWKSLDIVVEESADGDDMEVERPLTDPTEPRIFSTVVDGLKTSYPRDKIDELSTSFCFICLLHLANEQGLKIEKDVGSQANQSDEVDELCNDVGNLLTLKVYRDPTATRSA